MTRMSPRERGEPTRRSQAYQRQRAESHHHRQIGNETQASSTQPPTSQSTSTNSIQESQHQNGDKDRKEQIPMQMQDATITTTSSQPAASTANLHRDESLHQTRHQNITTNYYSGPREISTKQKSKDVRAGRKGGHGKRTALVGMDIDFEAWRESRRTEKARQQFESKKKVDDGGRRVEDDDDDDGGVTVETKHES